MKVQVKKNPLFLLMKIDIVRPLSVKLLRFCLALFLAYTNGAVGLCCSLLRAGAKLATINKHGVSIFNAPVATKKLLYKLLGINQWSLTPIKYYIDFLP